MIEHLLVLGLVVAIIYIGLLIAFCIENVAGQVTVAVIAVGLASIISSNCYAMSFERAKALFSHLENVAGYHVQLKLDPDTDFNAWNDSAYSITITQGLLDFCNDAQIISVMGHELGHLDRQDYKKTKGSFFQELHADVTGIVYCKKLGYSKTQCISFMYKARKTDGDTTTDQIHPSWTKRINNLLRAR